MQLGGKSVANVGPGHTCGPPNDMAVVCWTGTTSVMSWMVRGNEALALANLYLSRHGAARMIPFVQRGAEP